MAIRKQGAGLHPLPSSSPGCGPYLEGEFKFDQEREVDGLQDALLIQSVLDLFQLHHLRGGEAGAWEPIWDWGPFLQSERCR